MEKSTADMPKLSFNTILSVLAVGLVALFVGRYFYMKPGMINGEQAPGIRAPLLNGGDFQLSDLEGQYVLIDFWGSWCPPCRQENPALVKLYNKYKAANFEQAQGFTIVSIGIEDKRERWVNAIQQDSLNWPYHVYDEASSLRFFDSEIAQRYGVKQVPTKYLLNPEGRIIAVNPSVEEVEQRLSQATAG